MYVTTFTRLNNMIETVGDMDPGHWDNARLNRWFGVIGCTQDEFRGSWIHVLMICTSLLYPLSSANITNTLSLDNLRLFHTIYRQLGQTLRDMVNSRQTLPIACLEGR
jgi:hypothetical protein